MGTIGNAGVNVMHGPGYSNWDMTGTRTIPLGRSEIRVLKLRVEAYNAFNHTQFSGVSSRYTFNAARVNTNVSTSAFNGARPPRILSLDLRVQF